MIEVFRKIIDSFSGVTEAPHFERISFRVNKKIFATLDPIKNSATVKLSPEDQDLFSLHDKKAVFAVPNKWGKQGWTIVELDLVRKDVLEDILALAYTTTASKK